MTDDVYKAPEANLEETIEHTPRQFYAVSINKFTILYCATLGMYSIYWAYRNWKSYKSCTGAKVWPVPRAIFQIFFTHTLFDKVDETLKANGLDYSWNPSVLASVYVLMLILSNILERLFFKYIGSPYTDILNLLTVPVSWYLLSKSQKAINLSQDDEKGQTNQQLTGANWAWIALGIVMWLLAIAGVMLPESSL